MFYIEYNKLRNHFKSSFPSKSIQYIDSRNHINKRAKSNGLQCSSERPMYHRSIKMELSIIHIRKIRPAPAVQEQLAHLKACV